MAQSLGCADDMARPLHTATQPKSAQQQLEYQDLRELIPSRRFTLAAAVAAVALTLGGSPAAGTSACSGTHPDAMGAVPHTSYCICQTSSAMAACG